MSAALTIRSLGAVAPVGQIDFPTDSPDAGLLAAFNQRLQLLAEMESVCRYYDASDETPAKMIVFDALENSIPKMPARTPQGVMAKLWIALAHTGPFCANDEIRAESDTIRRCDFEEVEAFEERLDFDQQIIFRAIRDIRGWTVEEA